MAEINNASLTNEQIDILNNMCFGANEVQLGSLLKNMGIDTSNRLTKEEPQKFEEENTEKIDEILLTLEECLKMENIEMSIKGETVIETILAKSMESYTIEVDEGFTYIITLDNQNGNPYADVTYVLENENHMVEWRNDNGVYDVSEDVDITNVTSIIVKPHFDTTITIEKIVCRNLKGVYTPILNK